MPNPAHIITQSHRMDMSEGMIIRYQCSTSNAYLDATNVRGGRHQAGINELQLELAFVRMQKLPPSNHNDVLSTTRGEIRAKCTKKHNSSEKHGRDNMERRFLNSSTRATTRERIKLGQKCISVHTRSPGLGYTMARRQPKRHCDEIYSRW